MNINDILAKTKKKSETIVSSRRPPSIATDFRPYDTNDNTNESKKIDNKPITYQKQTDNISEIKPATKRQQTDNKPESENQQKIEINNKPIAEPTTYSVTNRQQIGNKLLKNFSISNLVGIQRAIIFIIYEECKNNRSSITREMTTEHLSELTKTTQGTVKVSLQRLEKKGVVIRKNFKVGRGGWSQYELPQEIYNSILMATNWQQTRNKSTTELATEPITNHTSSSSLLNKTTTETNNKNELPEEWLNIDIESLEIINFHKGHLIQLFRHGLDLDVVQQSINHYAFDLMENEKAKQIKTDPLSFFMGIMKRSGYYAAPENYESPKDRGRRLFLEQEAAKIKKKAEEERAVMKQYFDCWQQALTTDEKLNLAGKDEMVGRDLVLQIDKLREYYKENCWPTQYQKILNGEV